MCLKLGGRGIKGRHEGGSGGKKGEKKGRREEAGVMRRERKHELRKKRG